VRSPMCGPLRVACLIALSAACWAADEPQAVLSGSRLSVDAFVWSMAHFYRVGAGGLHSNELVFERANALVGVTGNVGSVASARVCVDAGYLSPRDVYVNLRWGNGLGLRVGQFLLPLGLDVMTEPWALPFVTNSLVGVYAKPNGTRDVGVLASWERARFAATAAVVNGSGANGGDNNERKDICGRVVIRPLPREQLEVALRGYWGWPGAPDSVWQTVAGEAALHMGKFVLQSEFQLHGYCGVRNGAGYALLCYDAGWVEPCGRIEWVAPRGRRPDVMLMGGANSRAFDRRVEVSLDCFYRRNYQDNWDVSGFVVRLQVRI